MAKKKTALKKKPATRAPLKAAKLKKAIKTAKRTLKKTKKAKPKAAPIVRLLTALLRHLEAARAASAPVSRQHPTQVLMQATAAPAPADAATAPAGESPAVTSAGDVLPPLTRLDGPEGAVYLRLSTVDIISNAIHLPPKTNRSAAVVRYITHGSGAKTMISDSLDNRTVLGLLASGDEPAADQ